MPVVPSDRWSLRAVPYVLLVAAVLFFFGSVVRNNSALDDVMVLTNNTYVQSGIAGIPSIFSYDSFHGATHKPATRLGWRYRPLSLAFFAIAYEFFGSHWQNYHWLSLLFYAIGACVAYSFLKRWIFKQDKWLPLLTVLFFIILPVHTEVVANTKSCDELLAFIFSILFLDHYLRWCFKPDHKRLVIALLSFLAALFSKESSVLMVFLAPTLLYVVTEKGPLACLRSSLPFILAIGLFLSCRLAISNLPDPQIDLAANPYLFATGVEKLATISWVLLEYLKSLFIPGELIYDYGYRHIPYVDFTSKVALLGALLHLASLVLSIYFVISKRLLGFLLLAYLTGMLLLSNLFFNVGPIMADRFIFTPGFFLITATVFIFHVWLTKLSKGKSILMLSILFLVVAPFAYSKTSQRISEWKDNDTLFTADLPKAPTSFRVIVFKAISLSEKARTCTDSLERIALWRSSIQLMERAYAIYPDYKMMYMDWGSAYYNLGQLDSAEWAWERHRLLYPTSSFIENNRRLLEDARFNLQLQLYNEHFHERNLPYLKQVLLKALQYRATSAPVWNLIGKVYYLGGQRDSARYAWERAVALDSSDAESKKFLNMP